MPTNLPPAAREFQQRWGFHDDDVEWARFESDLAELVEALGAPAWIPTATRLPAPFEYVLVWPWCQRDRPTSALWDILRERWRGPTGGSWPRERFAYWQALPAGPEPGEGAQQP